MPFSRKSKIDFHKKHRLDTCTLKWGERRVSAGFCSLDVPRDEKRSALAKCLFDPRILGHQLDLLWTYRMFEAVYLLEISPNSWYRKMEQYKKTV